MAPLRIQRIQRTHHRGSPHLGKTDVRKCCRLHHLTHRNDSTAAASQARKTEGGIVTPLNACRTATRLRTRHKRGHSLSCSLFSHLHLSTQQPYKGGDGRQSGARSREEEAYHGNPPCDSFEGMAWKQGSITQQCHRQRQRPQHDHLWGSAVAHVMSVSSSRGDGVYGNCGTGVSREQSGGPPDPRHPFCVGRVMVCRVA